MAKASDNEFPSVLFGEQASSPSTPSAGTARLFVDNAATPQLKLIDDAATVTTFGSGGGGGTVPEWIAYLAERQTDETSDSDDDFFDDGTKTGYTETTVSGTATWTESRDRMSLKAVSGGTGDAATLLKSITASGPPLTIETAVTPTLIGYDFFNFGLCFTDGTTSTDNIVNLGLLDRGASSDNIQLNTGTLTNYAATNRVSFGTSAFHAPSPGLIYFRLVWTAANTWAGNYSTDSVSWHDMGLAPFSFTMTPTHFGLFGAQFNSSSPSMCSFEYLRMNESNLDV